MNYVTCIKFPESKDRTAIKNKELKGLADKISVMNTWQINK